MTTEDPTDAATKVADQRAGAAEAMLATNDSAISASDVDKVTSAMGSYMLQGWTMLNDGCPDCNTPLMRNRESTSQICVNCEINPPVDQDEDNFMTPAQSPAAPAPMTLAPASLISPPNSSSISLPPPPTSTLPRPSSPTNHRISVLDPMMDNARKTSRSTSGRVMALPSGTMPSAPPPKAGLPAPPPPKATSRVWPPVPTNNGTKSPLPPKPLAPPPSLPLSPPPPGGARDMRRSPQPSLVFNDLAHPTTPTPSAPSPVPPPGPPPASTQTQTSQSQAVILPNDVPAAISTDVATLASVPSTTEPPTNTTAVSAEPELVTSPVTVSFTEITEVDDTAHQEAVKTLDDEHEGKMPESEQELRDEHLVDREREPQQEQVQSTSESDGQPEAALSANPTPTGDDSETEKQEQEGNEDHKEDEEEHEETQEGEDDEKEDEGDEKEEKEDEEEEERDVEDEEGQAMAIKDEGEPHEAQTGSRFIQSPPEEEPLEEFSREQVAAQEAAREQSQRASKLIGQKLLQGWTMMQDPCPQPSCHGVPLLRNREKKQYCVICQNYFQSEQDLQTKLQTTPHGTPAPPPTSRPTSVASISSMNSVTAPSLPPPMLASNFPAPPSSLPPMSPPQGPASAALPLNPYAAAVRSSASPNTSPNSNRMPNGSTQRDLHGRVSSSIILPPAASLSPSFGLSGNQILGKHTGEDLDRLASEDEETRRHIQVIRKVGEFQSKSLPPVPTQSPLPPPPVGSRPTSTYSNSSGYQPYQHFGLLPDRRGPAGTPAGADHHGHPQSSAPQPPPVPLSPEVQALVAATHKTIATILPKLEAYRAQLEMTENPKECQVLTNQIKGLMECLKACRETL